MNKTTEWQAEAKINILPVTTPTWAIFRLAPGKYANATFYAHPVNAFSYESRLRRENSDGFFDVDIYPLVWSQEHDGFCKVGFIESSNYEYAGLVFNSVPKGVIEENCLIGDTEEQIKLLAEGQPGEKRS
jgi:hypothetical protein